MTSLRPTFRIFLCIVLCTLTGCIVVGPKYHRPAATEEPLPSTYKEIPAHYKDSEGSNIAQRREAMLRGEWWRAFNDPDLNALEEQLNINNQNIKEFFENFMESRALIAEARAQYWPTVSVNPSWTRQKTSGNLTNSSQANTGRTSTLISFPIDVSWVPDFWGKIRNQVREYQYAAQVSAADLETERLTEQARLAQYYFEIRGQDALKKILGDIVVADQKALELAQSRYDTGIDD